MIVLMPEVDGLKLKMVGHIPKSSGISTFLDLDTEMQHPLHVDMIQQNLQTADYCSNMK
jgi:hypothetical protein